MNAENSGVAENAASKRSTADDMRDTVKAMPGVITAAGSLAGVAELCAVFVHGQVSLEIATPAAVLAIVIIIFIWQRLKRYRGKQPSAWAVMLVLAIALAVGTLGGLGIASATVALRHVAGSASASGSASTLAEAGCGQAAGGAEAGRILLPIDGATNIPVGNILTSYGTIQGLPSAHHLLLFLRADGTAAYLAGDTINSMVCGSAWSLNILVNGGVPIHAAFTLYLVDLGPGSWDYVNSPAQLSLRQNGFPSATPGPDARILSETHFVSYPTG